MKLKLEGKFERFGDLSTNSSLIHQQLRIILDKRPVYGDCYETVIVPELDRLELYVDL